MNKILDKKYPYLMNFFETAIKEKRLFHSIILYGSNNYIQYGIALELSRRLNCLESGGENCICRNCRWIRENKHPAVMTISKIDNKSSSDTAKTVISVQQTEEVSDKVYAASEYHKVFIFCDADIKKPSNLEMKEYEEFKSAGYAAPQEEADGKIWVPSAINRNCFQDASANSMLKSIEEPPARVTYIFLTNNTGDLISTIVSRSQAFYAPDTPRIEYNTDFLGKYFAKYPEFPIEQALEFSRTLLNYQTENGFEPEYILDSLEYYLKEILKSNSGNKFLADKILKDIKKIEEAGKMLKAYVKDAYVYEHLGFYFSGLLH